MTRLTTITVKIISLYLILHTQLCATQDWRLITSESFIHFIASYDGIEFNGEFEQFSIELLFDPLDPDTAQLTTTIQTNSVNTNSRDRDDALADSAWFHFSKYPHAIFNSTKFKKANRHLYRVDGTLTIRDQTRNITFPFEWLPQETGDVRVNAELELDRRDYDIGNGDWAQDETIGFKVVVKISLLLSKQS